MKRRDLLKGTGALALAVPAARALTGSPFNLAISPSGKDLVVNFAGPFCFWLQADSIKVMAPPVGPDYAPARHLPWFGTSANEKPVVGEPSDYKLVINGYAPPTTLPVSSGTTVFYYEQGAGSGIAPLFNLFVPMPNVIVGIVPTVVKMVCAPGTTDPYCKEWKSYASALTFVYQNVDLQGIRILQGAADYFDPCFINDQALPAAGLGVHLTPLEPLDPEHKHATKVWSQMLAMYPWMNKEITGIDFCPNFDPSVCNFDPASCGNAATHEHRPMKVKAGPANDCEVPGMMLGPVGMIPKHK